MQRNYVVRPKTGEVFPPESAEELLLSDRTLRIATNEEQREIVAGRDFRALYKASPETGEPAVPERFRRTDASILTEELSPHAPNIQPAAQVPAGINATMEVTLGRVAAGDPMPGSVPPDGAASEHNAVPLAEQMDAIDAIEDLDSLRATAENMGLDYKQTMNRETLRAVIKKGLIAQAAGTPVPAAAGAAAA